jgi:hypothetical protein
MTYIFIERPPIHTGQGSSSWAASPVQQSVFDPPPSDYNSGKTPPGSGLVFHFDDLFRDTVDEISATQLTGASLVGTQ